MAEEKNFENKIKKFLDDEGCWYVKFFANSFTKKGIPDLLCCVNGYFLAIEVKAENGKPSELQKWNVSKIRHCGGLAFVLKPSQFDSFKRMVRILNNEESGKFKVIYRLDQTLLNELYGKGVNNEKEKD